MSGGARSEVPKQDKPSPHGSLIKLDALLGAIVAFRMIIERVDAKFKLSQNRSAEDQKRVIAALRKEDFSDAEATAEWMASHAGER